MTITDKYICKVIGSHGPSMCPTLDQKDNILFIDCLTTRLFRSAKINEIVICENPFKPGATLVKRIIQTEN